jgi:hypothetical protein
LWKLTVGKNSGASGNRDRVGGSQGRAVEGGMGHLRHNREGLVSCRVMDSCAAAEEISKSVRWASEIHSFQAIHWYSILHEAHNFHSWYRVNTLITANA